MRQAQEALLDHRAKQTRFSKPSILLKIELYARSGILMKTMYVKEIEAIAGRQLPTRVEIVDALKKNSKTVFSMQSVKIDVAMPDSMFSMEALTK